VVGQVGLPERVDRRHHPGRPLQQRAHGQQIVHKGHRAVVDGRGVISHEISHSGIDHGGLAAVVDWIVSRRRVHTPTTVTCPRP